MHFFRSRNPLRRIRDGTWPNPGAVGISGLQAGADVTLFCAVKSWRNRLKKGTSPAIGPSMIETILDSEVAALPEGDPPSSASAAWLQGVLYRLLKCPVQDPTGWPH